MNEQIKNFSTNDITIASVLAYFGQELVEVNKNIRGDIEFSFRQSPDLQDIVKGFSLEELSVNPRRFSIVLKDMKKILYTYKESNN